MALSERLRKSVRKLFRRENSVGCSPPCPTLQPSPTLQLAPRPCLCMGSSLCAHSNFAPIDRQQRFALCMRSTSAPLSPSVPPDRVAPLPSQGVIRAHEPPRSAFLLPPLDWSRH
ncbi:hypothetical protein CRG98_027135 [Punica granatum]|uniref:Uncharacterized protein n=1 Tax=Punica granatum TaxID=22663 RepID=A0A2I0J8X6_PUNGR|nr:hypothetical protein CRG98_027135 [Punica granatum]